MSEKKNFASIELSGRIGSISELRTTRSGKSVIEVSVAYNTGKGKDDPCNKTVWFKCTAFSGVAEQIAGGYKKGQTIQIKRASPDLDAWTDKQGVERKDTKWIIWELESTTGSSDAPQRGEDQSPPPFNPDDDIPF